jgi:hypothetical protein
MVFCTTVVILQCFCNWILLERKTWMIRGSPRTPDRLPELSDLHALLSEVGEMMIGTCGPYDSSGSASAGIRACYYRSVVVLFYKTSK